MQKILTTISILILLFILVATPSWGVSEAGQSATRPVRLAPLPDPRVAKLEKFLKRVNSPLAPKAQVFIAKADQYELSFRAYGWANGNYYFKNWDESIDTVSKTLKTNYINRGAKTIEQIARIYAPPSKTWATNVRFFMSQIDSFWSRDPFELALNF